MWLPVLPGHDLKDAKRPLLLTAGLHARPKFPGWPMKAACQALSSAPEAPVSAASPGFLLPSKNAGNFIR